MRAWTALAAFLTLPAFAQSGLKLSVERVSMSGTFAKAVVRIDNGATAPVASVEVSCAFLVKGRAIDTASVLVSNIGAGATAFETALASVPERPDEAQCRIVRVRQ